MKLSPALQQAYNDQINLEYASMYAYAQLSAYCAERNLPGFAHWMRVQASEEHEHALKFTDFLLDRGGSLTLQPIAAPSTGFNSALEAFELALAHEEHVSAAIQALYTSAEAERDYASYPLLQWFIAEQIEEESSVGLIVERLRMAGDNSSAVLMLDRELAARQ
ncbi:MAG: ferritin [Dehalococcoidia bacterium]